MFCISCQTLRMIVVGGFVLGPQGPLSKSQCLLDEETLICNFLGISTLMAHSLAAPSATRMCSRCFFENPSSVSVCTSLVKSVTAIYSPTCIGLILNIPLKTYFTYTVSIRKQGIYFSSDSNRNCQLGDLKSDKL